MNIHQVQLDGVLAEVPSGVPPVAQQADGILAEGSPAVLLADPITAAPSTGWPERSCHETKLVWTGLMILFVFIILMKSCKVPAITSTNIFLSHPLFVIDR